MMVINGQLSIELIQAYLHRIPIKFPNRSHKLLILLIRLQSALASLERIFEILDYPEEKETQHPLAVPERIVGENRF